MHPPVAAGGCTGAPWASEGDVQRSLVLAVAALGSCTRPAPTFCVGTAPAWSTRANARIWHAEQLVEPTEPERGSGTTGRSSTRCRSAHPGCIGRPIWPSAPRLRQRRSWRSWLTRRNGRAKNAPSLAQREGRRGLLGRRSLTRQSLFVVNVVSWPPMGHTLASVDDRSPKGAYPGRCSGGRGLRGPVEPEIGFEPMTCSLRVIGD